MFKKLSKDYLLSNPSSSELEHLYSYSENHHVFNITIMCIKYTVDFIDGSIKNIDYHEDYANCFSTPECFSPQRVSQTIYNTASAIINYYLNDNLWLKGWLKGWKNNYCRIWDKKMFMNPETLSFSFLNPDEAYSYYLCKCNQNTTLLHRV